MKEGGEWKRREPLQGSTSTRSDSRSVISDWASLLPELVQSIADCVLSTTGGVDSYMNMRAVCPSWRSAVAKPSPLAAVADARFRPRHWLMVEMNTDNHEDDVRLFLHVPTGRFRRLRLPVLRDHIVVGATDGLIVLGDREPLDLAHVLNPFTGDMIHFAAPLYEDFIEAPACTAVSGSCDLTLVFLSWGRVLCAAPASDVFTEREDGPYLMSMVNFQGNICCDSSEGRVFEFIVPAELVVIAQMSHDVEVHTDGDDGLRSYLVESNGELLLARYVDLSLKVFRVNVEKKLLEEVKSLGGRALFLGDKRCVSVDADKLPSVDSDCIYMLDAEDNLCVYTLRGDMVYVVPREHYCDRPFSLVQVLLRYCDLRGML